MKIRVLIDARKLTDGGIGTYTGNLIEGLLASGECDLSILVRNSTIIPAHWGDRLRVIRYDAAPHSFSELFIGPKIIAADFDLFHAPHYNLPANISLPTVVTIHDLIHITNLGRAFLPWIARPLIARACRKSASVVTVSEASAQALVTHKFLNRAPDVIPNALDPFWKAPVNPSLSGAERPFFLTVLSNMKPHKGHRDLLLAFRDLLRQRSDLRQSLQLRIVGQGVERERLTTELSELALQDQVILEEYLPRERLRELYHQCRGVVIPSLLEGFGLPMLEAQASGAAVLIRPVTALQELVTAGDFVCTDMSIAALSRGMAELLTVEKPTDGSILERHLARFSLQHTTEQILGIYRGVLGREVRAAA